jgi:hypothetical protein
VVLVDERTDAVLCRIYPLDKARNADGRRRSLEAIDQTDAVAATAAPLGEAGIAPLLQRLLAEYAATGLPPAYLPKNDHNDEGSET